MKLLIHGRNLDVTPALKEYTESKIQRALSHFPDLVKETDVHLSVAKNRRVPYQTAEVTVFANGTIIRAQERSENLYASIDLVASKICRQLHRYKERHSDHHHSHGHSSSTAQSAEVIIDNVLLKDSLLRDKVAHLPSPGVRRKYFSMKPMSIESARNQLDLIDHSFYLFRNEANNELQVIYKRNHGGYGIIQEKK